MRTLALGVVAAALIASPAFAGGVIVCGPFIGCIGSPYFPPVPPIAAYPPVIIQGYYPPPDPAPLARVRPNYPVYPLDRRAEPYRAPPVRNQRVAPAPPQRDAASNEIEADIMAFCDGHPDEPFCGKLGAWLRKHPRSQQ